MQGMTLQDVEKMNFRNVKYSTVKKDGKTRLCAQCRKGYDDTDNPEIGPDEAEYYVRGTVLGFYDGRPYPYHGYICEGHLCVMQEDGAEFKEITLLKTPEEQKKDRLDYLTRKHTGWESFGDMCRNYPTLRLDHVACPTITHIREITVLRNAWETETGRAAFPQYAESDFRTIDMNCALKRLNLTFDDISPILDLPEERINWNTLTPQELQSLLEEVA